MSRNIFSTGFYQRKGEIDIGRGLSKFSIPCAREGGSKHQWNVATSSKSGMVWQYCSPIQQKGGALFHPSGNTVLQYMPLHLLVEGRRNTIVSMFSLRMVQNLPCAQIDNSLQFDFQLEYTSTNSIKTVYSLYIFDSTTVFFGFITFIK